MSGAPTVNVSNVVDDQPVRAITYLVLVLCFAATVSDGYNLGSASLAAPGVVRAFALARGAVAPMFSVALFGMLIGAAAGGFLGDRFGRKRGILVNTVLIAITGLACAAAQDFHQLLWLRFAVGLGLGGLLPNVTALMAEFMPRNVRATFTTYAFMGVTTGASLPAILSWLFVGDDWRVLFFIGGVIPLLVLPLLLFFLPESLKFLALQPARREELRIWLRTVAPDLVVPADAQFVLAEKHEDFFLASLFQGGLVWITPALWLVFICIMMVNFFINSWLPLMLADIGFSPAAAAGTFSFYYVGGITGGLVMGVALDRVGPVVLGLCAALGCVVTGLIGLQSSTAITDFLVSLVGFSVLGTQVGMSAIGGLLYPTTIRSKGAGFAHSIGRLGAIAGPLLAGYFISKQSSLFTLFLVPVIPLALAAAGFFFITRIWIGSIRGRGLADIRELESGGRP